MTRPGEKFPVTDIDSDIVRKYKPEFVAVGGESFVYSIPEHPDVVVKANKYSIGRIAGTNRKAKRPLDAMPPELEKTEKDEMENERKRFGRLKQYFGQEHVLGQRTCLMKVPVNQAIVEEITRNAAKDGIDFPNEMWAVVSIQYRIPDIFSGDNQDLTAEYTEWIDNVDEDAYARVTDALIFNREPRTITREDFFALASASLRDLVRSAERQPQLREALRDFLARAIRYTEETGEILDMAGSNNVIFTHINGEAGYLLLDALYPNAYDRRNMLELAKQTFRDIAAGKDVFRKIGSMRNTLNYVRTINGLAKLFDVAERINMVPEPEEAWDAKADLLKPIQEIK